MALLGVACAGATSVVSASDFSLGATGYVNFFPYKEYDPSYYALPIVHYESEYFYVDGITGGVKLFEHEHHELRLGIGWMPIYFKASHTDDRQLKRLDDRDTSMVVTTSYAYKTERFGRFDINFSGDTLSKSDGILVSTSYSYPHAIGWGTVIIPRVSLTWASSRFNDYYYGISGSEARRSGLERYDAGSTWTPSLHLSARKTLNDNWTLHGGVDVRFLPSEVKDSPMVDQSVSWGVGFGVDYRFQ